MLKLIMLSLVNEKCTPAALPDICIPRLELMKKLQLAAEGRFVYIGSPAGSGKTVTALLWNNAYMSDPPVREPERRMSLWISLDIYDNVPSVFYKLFASVLCSTQPENETMLSLLSDPAFSSSPVEYTVRIISELLPDERLFTLTFDDFHLLDNQDILKSFPLVLKRLPMSFVVLILSRNEPPQPLYHLFKDEKTALISRQDLKFSENELKSYYGSLGLRLSDEDAGLVLMATDGLAIGINAIAKKGMVSTDMTNEMTTEYVFANYVRDQLWENWEQSLRDFMMMTSVADEMTGKFAAALTGRKDAATVLQELCAGNTFVSKAGKETFRYHHLFLDFLRNMAKESGMNMRPLYKIAAEYYLEAEQYVLARHYAVQSGFDKIIFKVIYHFTQHTNPPLDEHAAYLKIFVQDVMPKGICDRYPYLYTTLLESAWISSDTVMVEHAWDKLKEYLPLSVIKYPKIVETFILYLATDYRKTLPQLIDEFQKLPPIVRFNKTYQSPTMTAQLPFLHRSFRDFSDSSEIFLQGDTKKLDRGLGLLLKDLYVPVKHCLVAGFLLEQNRLEEALASAQKAKAAAADIKSAEVIFCIYNMLTSIYLAMGNKSLMQKTLAETESFIIRFGAHFLSRSFNALKTKIRLFDADKKAAEEWLNNYFTAADWGGGGGGGGGGVICLYLCIKFTSILPLPERI